MKKILVAALILCLPLVVWSQVTLTVDGKVISKGTVEITTSTIVPPSPTSCVYTYSPWWACQSDGTQTRTVLSITPAGCTGTPVLSQSCTYVPPLDVTIPTIRYLMPPNKVNFGTQGNIAKGETKKYYINLPNEFAKIDTPTIRRDALVKGQNYREFEINIVDPSQASNFIATVTDPKGNVYPLQNSEGLAYIKFQNTRPAYPGRYLLTISATFAIGTIQGGCWVTWGTRPSPLEGELTR